MKLKSGKKSLISKKHGMTKKAKEIFKKRVKGELYVSSNNVS
jgi:hypothetical protein